MGNKFEEIKKKSESLKNAPFEIFGQMWSNVPS